MDFCRLLLTLAFLTMFASNGVAENWPQWRGPRGDGTSSEANIPTAWGPSENVAWKVPVPGSGHSSPIVWQDRIFVASCLEENKQRRLVCFDRLSGRQLWQQVVLE